ncbi:MAG: ISL3 family transposase [Solirubrobacterales bacterium]|nr:ISL3 family transposase [Solirubrobacterales bacterium]
MVVSSCRSEVECPDCQQRTRRVHSRYERTLADQPWNGIPTRLRLHTRRWFCDHPDCSRRIFTERFPGLARRYARRTDDQAEVLKLRAYVLGGEAGSRTAQSLGFPVSPDTLLRQVRRRQAYSGNAPRVLGVDDFAFLRGQRYGTILVDLESSEPIELLADRTAETLAAWLREHPGAEIISRDRSGAYAEGARKGAPHAIQVADRFHLLKNLTEALGEVLGREPAALRAAARPPVPNPAEAGSPPAGVVSAPHPAVSPAIPAPPEGRSRRARERSAQARERRRTRYEETVRLREEGWTARQTAIELGISRTTVNKFRSATAFPERQDAVPARNQVEPYAEYLRQRWDAGCRNAKQLWRELRERGFTGGFASVWRFTRSWRKSPPGTLGAAVVGDGSVPALPSPRSVVWWLLCPKKRTEAQTAFVERLEAESPSIRLAHAWVTEFFGMVRERKPEQLDDWLARVEASELPDLVSFCRGVRRDQEAVVAGLTLEWSNGQVEGQVNRLKLIKRQMYGRAAFDLLRARVLPPG